MENKKILITIIAVVIIGLFLINELRFIIWPGFGVLPKGTSPNCGPEDRYEFDVTINSKNDFVDFLKTNEINQWVSLDSFKNITKGMNYEDIKSAEVDWNKVLSEVKTENSGFKTIYVLDYNPYSCSGFTLKMTVDGYVSVYGCCGK